MSDNQMKLFPNPVDHDLLSFEGGNLSKVVNVSVYDITGKLIYSYDYPFSVGSKELYARLHKGVYIVKTEFEDHSLVSERMIKI